ncbi:MerC domain-containing protein [Dyadobacter tibetensis]|uniref:MerC domain-containing protein n=1 Tax=Dyadobacter tibetensis TaxID=1211851 RepID=UPI00046E75EE|nr:MerC domain-containing protein [Dyadobacter tibetensis]
MKTQHPHNKADYIGILGSILCIIHCLLLPAVSLGSALGHGHGHSHNSGLLSLDLLFIVVNGIAVYYATKSHPTKGLKLTLWGSLALFAISIVFEGEASIFTWLGYLASVMLIGGHFYNLYICQIAPRMKFRQA